MNCEILKSVLMDEHMTVMEVHNGSEAIDAYMNADVYTYDIILMDVMMPVIDGLEAARVIRESHREDAKTIPIFALTADAFLEDKMKCTKAGMNEHFAKPINRKELLLKISEYLSE